MGESSCRAGVLPRGIARVVPLKVPRGGLRMKLPRVKLPGLPVVGERSVLREGRADRETSGRDQGKVAGLVSSGGAASSKTPTTAMDDGAQRESLARLPLLIRDSSSRPAPSATWPGPSTN